MNQGTKQRIQVLVRRWYRKHMRDLPWRHERDPYRILLSEVMLQQTQVSRVLMVYPRFLRRYPTLHHLARARTSSVIRSWQGMGYNNRAVRLQQLARQVVRDFDGSLPRTIDELMQLPGIGRYTASAVSCFAFSRHTALVDTNISRILHRLFPRQTNPHRNPARDDWMLAEELLPRTNSSAWNQALMDLGATICTASSPRCGACPLAPCCPSAHGVRRTNNHTTSREPGRAGIPNRIYRGRIIETLRALKHGESMPINALGRQIKRGFQKRDHRWFESLLQSLERDGLIQRHTRSRLSLPL